MGLVNFNTEVTKDVTITKTVTVDVDKDVSTSLDLDGSLATSEASADALFTGGGDGNGNGVLVPGETVVIDIDDFLDDQIVIANPQATNPASSTATVTSDFDLERRLFIEVLSVEGSADIGVDNPLTSQLDFSAGSDTFANGQALYTPGSGAPFFDFLPGDDFTNEDVEALPGLNFATLTGIDFDPGTNLDTNTPATARVALVVTDSDGDRALTSAVLTGSFEDLTLNIPLIRLLDDSFGTPGEVLAGTASNGIVFLGAEDDVDGDGGDVDLAEVVSFQFILEDRPETDTDGNNFNTADFFPIDSVVDENLSDNGTDLNLADISLTLTPQVEQEGGGVLAETEVFAQVDETGAFAFADALAASDPTAFESSVDLIFGA